MYKVAYEPQTLTALAFLWDQAMTDAEYSSLGANLSSSEGDMSLFEGDM